FVRGAAQLRIRTAKDTDLLSAPRAASWSEHVCSSADEFDLDLGESRESTTELAYWCERGAVPAGRLVVAQMHFSDASAASHGAPQRAAEAAKAPPTGDASSTALVAPNPTSQSATPMATPPRAVPAAEAPVAPSVADESARSTPTGDDLLTNTYFRRLIE